MTKSAPCVILLCSALAAGGCATTASFKTVGGNEGRLGRYYEIDVGGKNWGDAKVWSPGAYPTGTDGKKEVVQLNLRLRNDSTEVLTVDFARTDLEIATEDGTLYFVDRPEKTVGIDRASPESTERLEFFFALPKGVSPRDIDSLELSWVIRTPNGVYSQSTPFVREERSDGETARVYYSPWFPWYRWDPWTPWHTWYGYPYYW